MTEDIRTILKEHTLDRLERSHDTASRVLLKRYG
jgi:hypothetical protein